MNKTVNINLGGLFFHMDEDAYQKLNRYFDAIKRSLSNSNGQDEIMKDIEMRISELFMEGQKTEQHVISLKDVDAVIAVMGQPEDYRIEEENDAPYSSFNSAKKSKKLYRDIDKNILGGVAAGFGHYLGVDAIWIRLLLLLIVIAGFGFPILIYIIFWVLVPKAQTTSEKLEMTGEPINLSNIEKKVREEFDSISGKVKNVEYDKMGSQIKSGAERIGSSIGEVFMSIFNIFAKILGAIIVVISIVVLGGLVISLFTFGSISIIGMPWQSYYDAVIVSEFPIWLITLLSFFAIGIPFFFLLILGLKLLITNMKSVGNGVKYTLLALWLIATTALIAFGIKQATEVAKDGKIIHKEALPLALADTLTIAFKGSDFYTSNDFNRYRFEVTENEKGEHVIYSNNINLHILPTNEKQAYIEIERKAEGKSINVAKKRAENIEYHYLFDGKTLTLNNYFVTDLKHKYRDQIIKVYLYLPEGTLFKADKNIYDFDNSDDEIFNFYYSDTKNYIYKMDKSKADCLNCPAEEFDEDSIIDDTLENDSIKTISIKVNDKEVLRTESGSKNFKLEIDENGLIKKVK